MTAGAGYAYAGSIAGADRLRRQSPGGLPAVPSRDDGHTPEPSRCPWWRIRPILPHYFSQPSLRFHVVRRGTRRRQMAARRACTLTLASALVAGSVALALAQAGGGGGGAGGGGGGGAGGAAGGASGAGGTAGATSSGGTAGSSIGGGGTSGSKGAGSSSGSRGGTTGSGPSSRGKR
jgi:hypothetical protein